MQPPLDLSDGRWGKIVYPSASPFEIHHILRKLDEAPEHPVFGSLLVPENPPDGPMPCIVAVHGSLNWRGHHHEHIVRWLDAGMCVFRVHTFDSRRVYSIVEDQMQVTHAMMLVDCYQALCMLATHPSIDASKIGLAGWSLGGTVALYGAWEPVAEALAPEGDRFSAHLSFYPAAHMRTEVQRWTDKSILVLHGSEDDWVPLKLLEGLIEDLRPHDVDITVHVYEGAPHSFDSIEPLDLEAKAIRLDDHRTLTIDSNGDMWGELEPGISMPLNEPEDRLAAFQVVGNLGAHKGVDWEARKHSLEYGAKFLRDNLAN
ncbi:MAG: dienelactone hydrolase family protein [Candidatus Thermoplasmatota archaeon]|nr:dienelactone hydrolase family protein [Candidatus Thermoplasmatota archaeon]